MQRIEFKQRFHAPIQQVFNDMTDHAAFGRLLRVKIRRIKDGADPQYPNGLGSVRRISPPGLPVFEETVIRFDANRRMDYTITKGSPIKNHRGTLQFRADGNGTQLEYTIRFEPKLGIPFLGKALEFLVGTPIQRAIKQLARRYESGQQPSTTDIGDRT